MRLYIVDESEAGQFSGLADLANSEPLTVDLAVHDKVSKLFKRNLTQGKFIIVKSTGIDLATQESKVFYVVIKRSADIDIYFSGQLQSHTSRSCHAITTATYEKSFEKKLKVYECHNQQTYFPRAPASVQSTPAPTPGPSKHGTPVSNHASRAPSFAQNVHMSSSSSSNRNHPTVNQHPTASTGAESSDTSTQVSVTDSTQQSDVTLAQQPEQHAAADSAVPSTPATNPQLSTAALVMTMTQTATTSTTVPGSDVANVDKKDAATLPNVAVLQTPSATTMASGAPTPVLNLDHVMNNTLHIQQAPDTVQQRSGSITQQQRSGSITQQRPTQPLRLSSQRSIVVTVSGAVVLPDNNANTDVHQPLLPKDKNKAGKRNDAAQSAAQAQPKSTSCCAIV